MASISTRNRANGTFTWRVTFQLDHRQRQESFPTESGAVRFKNMVETMGPAGALRVLASRQEPEHAPTLAEWTAQFLSPDTGMLTGITGGTRATHQANARRTFLRHSISEMPIDAIQRDDIAQWVQWQESQPSARSKRAHAKDPKIPVIPISPRTVKNALVLFGQILQAAVDRELIPRNPTKSVRVTGGRRPEICFLTETEFKTLLCCTPDRWKPLVDFLAMTGCRWGEATAVTFGDINRDSVPPTVRINKAWKHGAHGFVLGAPKSEAGNRTIAVPTHLMDEIGTGSPTQLVFRAVRGGRVAHNTFWEQVWTRTVAKANDPRECAKIGRTPIGKHPRIHDLRHSHVSWLIDQRLPLEIIKRRMGHSSIKVTSDVYGHLLPDFQQQAVSAVESALGIES